MRIEGKVAIVTGAASGIGAACAETLARAGAKVVATDVDGAAGAAAVRKIVGAGGDALFLDQDVTDEARWPQIISARLFEICGYSDCSVPEAYDFASGAINML